MAHERTREILWAQREIALFCIQDIDRETAALNAKISQLNAERLRAVERARHLEIAAVTLDMKDTPS